MIHVLARITVQPDAAEQALAILRELAAQSRQESGCISYQLYQQSRQPQVFQTVEQWRDQASVDAHMSTAHVAAAIVAAGPLFAAPPEIETWVLTD
jgi:quinol monooxygenase YgiN